MYEYRTRVRINNEHIPKLEEMLKEKLKATSVVFREEETCWIVSFVVDSTRKFFTFKKVVRDYGGQNYRYRLSKRQHAPTNSD